MSRPAAVLAMAPGNLDRLFDQTLRARLGTALDVDLSLIVTDFVAPALSDQARAALDRAELLLTCWGVPRLDETALATMPRLRTIVHAAGSVKGFVTDACWDRGLSVSSAVAANAVPVAEYTVAMILLTGKRFFALEGSGRRSWAYDTGRDVGNFGRRVGVVGASRVGRAVIELLRAYDLEVVLADPTIGEADAAALGVALLDLDELCETCDVVSIHAPDIPATRQMFDARRLGLIRDGATLINTARGRIVDTEALTRELETGRIAAILDVTDPEPLPDDHRLRALPNVVLTPHIAGSQGNEVRRMGLLATEEVERFVRGQAYAHPVSREQWEILA